MKRNQYKDDAKFIFDKIKNNKYKGENLGENIARN